MNLEITSPALKEGQPIPAKYTGDGRDLSPPLKWHDPPENTQSFALICEDPDAPRGTYTHWVIFNIPPGARELPEGVPPEATLSDRARTILARSAMEAPPLLPASHTAISSSSSPSIRAST